ncbi:MAG: response regulator [Candidatus Wallbacteria bacterium]|nr:response regulator [Candidatus Wallbacteria bacterium]
MHKIMVVEDDPSQVELLKKILGQFQIEVHAATDGLKAVDLIREVKPGLILLDIMMPALDGFEVVKRIRAMPELAATPIIIISAVREMNSLLEARKHGIKDYVMKPFDRRALEAKIGEALKVNLEELKK